jgi:N-acetylmuramoyl-L-alanine amidase
MIGSLTNIVEEAEYFKAKVQEGDGVYSLLRRYQLDKFSCNFDHFYQLNNLSRNAQLTRGKDYLLPILIYKYDGKSIRSTLGISDWNQALRIKEYNEQILAQNLRKKSYIDSKILWVPYHELHCAEQKSISPSIPKESKETDTIATGQKEVTKVITKEDTKSEPIKINAEIESEPTTNKGNRTFPIFGPKYAYTPIESNALSGKVFYLISGHGGPDPGAIGRRGEHQLCEDEYAYDVALRLCRNLIAHGAIAYMIVRDLNDGIRSEMYLNCDTDEVIWGNAAIERGHKARLGQRTEIINNLAQENELRGVKQQTVIEIHVDSRSTSQQVDLYFYHHPSSKEGKKLAEQLHKTIESKYKKHRANGEYHGTVTSRDLFTLRESKPTAVFIELGNIAHSRDQQRIILEDNRQALANWLLEGLMK